MLFTISIHKTFLTFESVKFSDCPTGVLVDRTRVDKKMRRFLILKLPRKDGDEDE